MKPSQIIAFLQGDLQADRAIPKRGFTAQLATLVAAALAFLAVFVLAMAFSASRMAGQWAGDLTGVTTIQIPAEGADTDIALGVLQNAPGVTSARVLSAEEQEALLAPWLGSGLPSDLLPIPQLIELTTTGDFDVAALSAQLSATVPGAVINDHDSLRRPLIAVAQRLRVLGWVTIGLIAFALIGLVTLAAKLSLASNLQTISVLRLVGATDTYIANAFMRRFMLRAAIGAAVGTILGFVALQLAITADAATAIGLAAPFGGGGGLWLILIPVLSGLAALIATCGAAQRMLRTIP